KIREIRDLMSEDFQHIEILGLSDYDIGTIEENGNSFSENAMIKSRTVSAYTGLPVLADDSGLCVHSLGGHPGIYSSRYSGRGDQGNIDKLLLEMLGTPKEKRGAYFECSICYTDARGISHVFSGKAHGIIAEKRKGCNGFGYDPVFYIPEIRKTMAELTPEEKNRISHRAHAIKDFLAFLSKNNTLSA
ncbi:MAG: RdgB/HAM1 family non-canonical purine NTP pyrophosphatase, partial [Candidatus Muiribacteriaceae bacterium]